MCVKETGTSAKLGDQNCPIRTVVRPLLRSAKIKRPRICGCSSPNGGTPLNAPKKSNSTVARGAHLPSTGAPVKVKFKRVFCVPSLSGNVKGTSAFMIKDHVSTYFWASKYAVNLP